MQGGKRGALVSNPGIKKKIPWSAGLLQRESFICWKRPVASSAPFIQATAQTQQPTWAEFRVEWGSPSLAYVVRTHSCSQAQLNLSAPGESWGIPRTSQSKQAWRPSLPVPQPLEGPPILSLFADTETTTPGTVPKVAACLQGRQTVVNLGTTGGGPKGP